MHRLLSCLSLALTGLALGEKPNILIFLVDDLGWKDLSCYGSSFYETPAIDRLAQEGVQFINAYASSPVCSPTRAALMTGKHPARVGITDWIPGHIEKNPELEKKLKTPRDLHQLPLAEVTLAEAFQEGGYTTFYAGKWHLGGEGYSPKEQGFMHYVDPHQDSAKGSPGKGPVTGRKHATPELTEATIRFLTENRDKPHLAFLSYYDVHTPIIAEKKFLKKYQKKAQQLGPTPAEITELKATSRTRQDDPAYASMVHAVDESVAQVLAKLAELQLTKNTIIIFTSDNGGLATSLWKRPTCNLPLRAGKGLLYEGGIKIPLIIKAPQLKPQINDSPALSSDLYPTLLTLAGLPLKTTQHVDGADLFSLSQDRPLFWHFPHFHSTTWTPGTALRSGPWKLIHFYEDAKDELYHLSFDPGETTNLAASHPKELARMKKELKKAIQHYEAQEPTTNP